MQHRGYNLLVLEERSNRCEVTPKWLLAEGRGEVAISVEGSFVGNETHKLDIRLSEIGLRLRFGNKVMMRNGITVQCNIS